MPASGNDPAVELGQASVPRSAGGVEPASEGLVAIGIFDLPLQIIPPIGLMQHMGVAVEMGQPIARIASRKDERDVARSEHRGDWEGIEPVDVDVEARDVDLRILS